MIIYQWTLINRLPDDKALHEIAYLWCRLSSLSTPALTHRGRLLGALFYRVFLDHSFSSLSFFAFLHTPDRSRFLRSRIFSFPHGSGPFSWKRRRGEETYSEPLADREDSGNKNTRGSKHSSWGFPGVVITITTPFTTTSDSRTTPVPSSWPHPFSPVILFYLFAVVQIGFHAPRE